MKEKKISKTASSLTPGTPGAITARMAATDQIPQQDFEEYEYVTVSFFPFMGDIYVFESSLSDYSSSLSSI